MLINFHKEAFISRLRSKLVPILDRGHVPSRFTLNSIKIIHAPSGNCQTWHVEQRSISGGSKLIEQTLHGLRWGQFAFKLQSVLKRHVQFCLIALLIAHVHMKVRFVSKSSWLMQPITK